MNRRIKQLIYIFFFLFFFGLIFTLVYLPLRKPKPKPESEIQFKPLKVSWFDYTTLPNKLTLLGEIVNPNLNALAEFNYKLDIFGSFGTLLKSVEASSFIYPGQRKYVIIPAVTISTKDVSFVNLSIEEARFEKSDRLSPRIEAVSIVKTRQGKKIYVQGKILNREGLSLKDVKIIVGLFKEGKLIGASNSFFNEIEAGDKRDFIVIIPVELTQIKEEPKPKLVFNQDLKLGSRSPQVKELQKFLNQNPLTRVAESGPGSPGNETEYFGYLTKIAVKKFQELHSDEILKPLGLSSGTGYFGKSTRDYVNYLITKETKPRFNLESLTTEIFVEARW